MFGLGTLINTGAVIAGGLIGMTLKKGIPESCREVLMEACGVSTIFIGIGGVLSKMLVIHNGTLETQGTMLLIFSLILGSLAGSLLNIEMKLEEFGEFLKKKFNSKKASFTELKRGIIDRETLKLAEQPFEIAEQFED